MTIGELMQNRYNDPGAPVMIQVMKDLNRLNPRRIDILWGGPLCAIPKCYWDLDCKVYWDAGYRCYILDVGYLGSALYRLPGQESPFEKYKKEWRKPWRSLLGVLWDKYKDNSI